MQRLKRYGLYMTASVFLVSGLLYVLSGCCYPVDPDDEQPGIENPSFAQHVQPIFTANCALSGCHNAGAAAGLDLRPDMSHAQLVGITSSQDKNRSRVDPGDVPDSYLVVKLEGRQSVGSRMPLGRPPLSADEIDTIRNWINLGAEDNR